MPSLSEMVRESVEVYGVAPTCHLSALTRMDDYRLVDLDRSVGVDRLLCDPLTTALSTIDSAMLPQWFLEGGRVVGVWDPGKTDRPLAIKLAPLGSWSSYRWDAVEREAHRLGVMIGTDRVTIKRVIEPVDLVTVPRNCFSPLSKRSDASFPIFGAVLP